MKQLNWLDSAAEEARRQSPSATAAESAAAAAAATAAATGAADASAAAVAPPPSPKASAPSPAQLPSMPPSLLYCNCPGGRALVAALRARRRRPHDRTGGAAGRRVGAGCAPS